MTIMNKNIGTTPYHLARNFAVAETQALLAGSADEHDSMRRAANVSLVLSMEKFVWYKMKEINPELSRIKPLAESVDLGFSGKGEKLMGHSVVKTAFYSEGDDGSIHGLKRASILCTPNGFYVSSDIKNAGDFSSERMPNVMDIKEAFEAYTERLCVDIDFGEFETMVQEASNDLLAEQPRFEAA